jgi:hypothetical protein
LLWLKTNCDLSERNPQIYMQLANNMTKLKSAEAADLSTLADALRFIQIPDGSQSQNGGNRNQSQSGGSQRQSGRGGGSHNASDLYDRAQEKLIKKLQALSVAQAEAAADATIKQLRNTVATMKAGAKSANAA